MGHKKHPKPQKSKDKKKKKANVHKNTSPVNALFPPEKMRKIKEQMKEMLAHKDEMAADMNHLIDDIINVFARYDTVQLLGGMGLKLIDNLPNLEKMFFAQMDGENMNPQLDEDAEVIAEYAMNFGLSMPNGSQEQPSEDVIERLYGSLKQLKHQFVLLDMPSEKEDVEGWFTWVTHSNLISVRGDGYAEHVEEVWQEMFFPHTPFFEAKYGFSAEDLFEFCTTIETRLISKVGSQDAVYGSVVAYDRWKKWMQQFEKEDGELDVEQLIAQSPDNPITGAFVKANPDMACPDNSGLPVLYDPKDFSASDKIFWVVPQNGTEENILRALSVEFGSNTKFIEGEFRGNIMNGPSIFTKPIIKDGNKYYCFTPMLLHRNLFVIAESLIKGDQQYYNHYFQENTQPISRDNYIERKTKEEFERFLPNVTFYPSVTYRETESGENRKTELDILGVSDKATYVIEVKAHELTHRDKVGIKGMKVKFSDSIGFGCSQSCRAEQYIYDCENSVFYAHGTQVSIDKTLI